MAAAFIASVDADALALLQLELGAEVLASFALCGSLAAWTALERIAAGAWPAEAIRRDIAAANLAVLRRLREPEAVRA